MYQLTNVRFSFGHRWRKFWMDVFAVQRWAHFVCRRRMSAVAVTFCRPTTSWTNVTGCSASTKHAAAKCCPLQTVSCAVIPVVRCQRTRSLRRSSLPATAGRTVLHRPDLKKVSSPTATVHLKSLRRSRRLRRARFTFPIISRKSFSYRSPSVLHLSLIHIWRCRRSYACRSRWSPYH